MCEAIQESRAEGEAIGVKKGRAEGKTKGILSTPIRLLKKEFLTLAQAAEEAKMPSEEFQLKAAEQP